MGKRIEIYNLHDLREVVRDRRKMTRKSGNSCISLMGEVFLDHKRDGKYLCFEEYQGKNIIPTAGLNHILDSVLDAATQITSWYVGIFKTNYTPIASNTAANSLGAAGFYGECQDADYDTPATNKPAYDPAAASAGVMTNAASKAAFTINASITLYGAFLSSAAAKTATTGTLFAAKKFDTSRAVVDADEIYVTYQLTATSS